MTDKKTLEDALAEIEASNAKAAELRAKQAPELIAAAVKRTALNARLAALPQAQRRQVLDAAGMKHVSAAPDPITRLKGRGSSYTQPRTPVALCAIDWRYWRHMPEIKQWEACALSLNINPDNMQHSPQGWMAGPGSGPTFLAVNFPSQAVQLEFEKRVRLLGASLFKSPHFTTVNNLVMGGRHLATLRLTEFAAWCLSVELEMPPELKAMAATPQASKPSEPQAPPVVTAGASDGVELASDGPAKTATVDRGWVMKKAALIGKHANQWPTINRDFQDASENGLSKAAKAPGHGGWFEADALNWARQRGKLTEATEQTTGSHATPFTGLTHRIKP